MSLFSRVNDLMSARPYDEELQELLAAVAAYLPDEDELARVDDAREIADQIAKDKAVLLQTRHSEELP